MDGALPTGSGLFNGLIPLSCLDEQAPGQPAGPAGGAGWINPPEVLQALALQLRYAGMAVHKLHPGDYGFIPPNNPRPHKSVCDARGPVLRHDAMILFRKGLAAGMVSAFDAPSTPKYVWAVADDGEPYEAKTKPPDTVYHGYRIQEDEIEMRRYILAEWRMRCLKG